MKKCYVLLFAIFAVVMFFGATKTHAETTSLRLKATADAFISSGQPNSNVPTGILSVSNSFSPDVITKSLVKFDLSQIPTGATVNSANFGVYIHSCSPSGSEPQLFVRRLISVWSETTVTWATNIRATDVGMANPLESTCAFENSIDFNVKEIVQSWVSGSSNYGFLISGSESQVYEQYYFSRDHSMEYPYLEIDYSYAADSTTAPASDTTGAGSGTTGSTTGTSSASSSTNSSSNSSAATTNSDGTAATNSTGENPSENSTVSKSETALPTMLDAIKNPTKIFSSGWLWWKKAIAIWIVLMVFAIIAASVFLLVRKLKKIRKHKK